MLVELHYVFSKSYINYFLLSFISALQQFAILQTTNEKGGNTFNCKGYTKYKYIILFVSLIA